MNQISSTNWPSCADHFDSPYTQILFPQKSNLNRLLCDECLYSQEKTKYRDEINESIPLAVALRSPGIMINQMLNNQESKRMEGLFKICEFDLEKQFDEQISKFELLIQIYNQMKEQINQKRKEHKDIQERIKQLRDEFYTKCNCNILRELIGQLKQLEKQVKSDQYTQILAKINSTIEEMLKDNCSLISKNIQETIKNLRQFQINLTTTNNDKFIYSISQLFQQYSDFLKELNNNDYSKMINLPKFKILTTEYFYILQQKIEEGLKKKVDSLNLIYLGSRDGLNQNAFWNKVNGKCNLLMIFKSQNNQVFGGFSPCQWETCQGKYVQDDTLASFLFSETKKQIYGLKQEQKQYAIYCHQSNGPKFGNGNDMCIHANLSEGCSKLGSSYYLDEQYKSTQTTHFYGDTQPKTVELEIYETILS